MSVEQPTQKSVDGSPLMQQFDWQEVIPVEQPTQKSDEGNPVMQTSDWREQEQREALQLSTGKHRGRGNDHDYKW